MLLDTPHCPQKEWMRFCQLMIRTVCQQKIELAEEHDCPENEFDFTIAFAVVGLRRIGFFQVGDGALVLRRDGACHAVFMPDKGEFDNQTSFLHPGDDAGHKYHAVMEEADGVTGLAVTSDGPEYLMFELPSMTPGPIFSQMFTDLQAGQFPRQSSLDYLTGSRWSRDPRGNDDRSLAIAAPLPATPHAEA